MNILALDLGTDCGFAIFKNGKFISGTKKLGTYKEKFGARFYEFRKWLLNIIAKHNISIEYMYSMLGGNGTSSAIMVFQTNENEKVFRNAGLDVLRSQDVGIVEE